jgi:hypothetical protein
MRMLSGEMKVDAMASLLTTLIERQTLMESSVRTMRARMMRRMGEQREPAGRLARAGAWRHVHSIELTRTRRSGFGRHLACTID